MKTLALILGTVILFAISAISIIGCGNSEQKNKEEIAEHTDKNEHHEEEAETGDHDKQAEQSDASGGHMQHMNEIREWLKEELEDKYDQLTPSATEEQLVRGKEIYTKICASCHGENGKGDGPAAAVLESKPADFSDPVHSKYYSDRGRMYIIKKGVRGTPMVGWGAALNEEKIHTVYAYVRSLRTSEGSDEHDHSSHEH